MGNFTVRAMLSFGVVCNYLWLGKTEFDNHVRRFDFEKRLTPDAGGGPRAGPLARKIHLLYTPLDFWGPLEGRARAEQAGIATSVLGPTGLQARGDGSPVAEPPPLQQARQEEPAAAAAAAAAAAGGEVGGRFVPHAFGVTREASERVAEWTARHLAAVVLAAANGGD